MLEPPSQISDSLILKYVLSEPDGYVFGDERRGCDVGITRAKKHTRVLYDSKNPSIFVRAFISLPDPVESEENAVPDAGVMPEVALRPCPGCEEGGRCEWESLFRVGLF